MPNGINLAGKSLPGQIFNLTIGPIPVPPLLVRPRLITMAACFSFIPLI
jgi:hypothetical protein